QARRQPAPSAHAEDRAGIRLRPLPGGRAVRQPPRRRFFWRVYLNGVLLLVLIGVALFVVSRLFEDENEPAAYRMLGYLGEHLVEARADPPRLAHELARALDV